MHRSEKINYTIWKQRGARGEVTFPEQNQNQWFLYPKRQRNSSNKYQNNNLRKQLANPAIENPRVGNDDLKLSWTFQLPLSSSFLFLFLHDNNNNNKNQEPVWYTNWIVMWYPQGLVDNYKSFD